MNSYLYVEVVYSQKLCFYNLQYETIYPSPAGLLKVRLFSRCFLSIYPQCFYVCSSSNALSTHLSACLSVWTGPPLFAPLSET